MTLRDLRHARHGGSRVGEQDVTSKFKETQDGPLLSFLFQLLERSGQVATRSEHSCTACPVVPVVGGVQDYVLAFDQAD